MSDLAPFVAACLRDKVVTDLQEEVQQLREQLQQEQLQSQTVAITGPCGSPVYAQALFGDGKYDYSPELWKVDLLKKKKSARTTTSSKFRGPCFVENLSDMEVRIGGICKAKLSNGIVEGFVNDLENNYDDTHKRGTLSIWFGGSSGIWLNVQIQPILRHQYAALRDFDLGGESLVGTLLQFISPYAEVTFTEVSFLISYVNDAMDRWGLLGEQRRGEQQAEDEETTSPSDDDGDERSVRPIENSASNNTHWIFDEDSHSNEASVEVMLFVDDTSSSSTGSTTRPDRAGGRRHSRRVLI